MIAFVKHRVLFFKNKFYRTKHIVLFIILIEKKNKNTYNMHVLWGIYFDSFL